MSDYMIQATAADLQIRAFAVTARDLAEEARKAHQTAPIATAALGRLLSATVMMGSDMLKNDGDLITVQIDGDGPMRGLLATADNKGNVKGFVRNPAVILPNRANGHLDVGGAVGNGTLTVIRDLGMEDPYSGQVELQSGEIAEDLTYYFAASEQIPSSVGLGVLVDRDYSVRQAGGYIIQLMPFASEETIDTLERNLKALPSVTELFELGMTPEAMLEKALFGLDVKLGQTRPVQFHCNCDRDRVERALVLLGKDELQSMIEENKEQEVKCHFCNKAYHFTPAQLKVLQERAK